MWENGKLSLTMEHQLRNVEEMMEFESSFASTIIMMVSVKK